MRRMKLSIKILMIPIMLALLCGAGGCYCLMPWEWWDHDSRHDGERGYHRGHDGDGHHNDGERGDHHQDGHRD
jgi:hypothetical protein